MVVGIRFGTTKGLPDAGLGLGKAVAVEQQSGEPLKGGYIPRMLPEQGLPGKFGLIPFAALFQFHSNRIQGKRILRLLLRPIF